MIKKTVNKSTLFLLLCMLPYLATFAFSIIGPFFHQTGNNYSIIYTSLFLLATIFGFIAFLVLNKKVDFFKNIFVKLSIPSKEFTDKKHNLINIFLFICFCGVVLTLIDKLYIRDLFEGNVCKLRENWITGVNRDILLSRIIGPIGHILSYFFLPCVYYWLSTSKLKLKFGIFTLSLIFIYSISTFSRSIACLVVLFFILHFLVVGLLNKQLTKMLFIKFSIMTALLLSYVLLTFYLKVATCYEPNGGAANHLQRNFREHHIASSFDKNKALELELDTHGKHHIPRIAVILNHYLIDLKYTLSTDYQISSKSVQLVMMYGLNGFFNFETLIKLRATDKSEHGQDTVVGLAQGMLSLPGHIYIFFGTLGLFVCGFMLGSLLALCIYLYSFPAFSLLTTYFIFFYSFGAMALMTNLQSFYFILFYIIAKIGIDLWNASSMFPAFKSKIKLN